VPEADHKKEKRIEFLGLTAHSPPGLKSGRANPLWVARNPSIPTAWDWLNRVADASEIFCGGAGSVQKRLQSVKIFYIIGRSSQKTSRFR
jgi:hypothetical protein